MCIEHDFQMGIQKVTSQAEERTKLPFRLGRSSLLESREKGRRPKRESLGYALVEDGGFEGKPIIHSGCGSCQRVSDLVDKGVLYPAAISI